MPPGTYTVSAYYSDYAVYESYFDWSVDYDYGYSKHMYSDTDYQLTDTAVVPDDYTYDYVITMYRI